MESDVDREELHAAIQARHELGAELEPHVIDSFVERIERRLTERKAAPAKRHDRREGAFVLAVVSIVMAIPITAIAATHGGIVAMLVVWAGIVLVNLAYNRR